jgi:hypothetical protein
LIVICLSPEMATVLMTPSFIALPPNMPAILPSMPSNLICVF